MLSGLWISLILNALDKLICICRLWVRAIRGSGRVSMTLSCGTVLEGELHPGWHKAGADPLITTLDLRAAYKQSLCPPSLVLGL